MTTKLTPRALHDTPDAQNVLGLVHYAKELANRRPYHNMAAKSP